MEASHTAVWDSAFVSRNSDVFMQFHASDKLAVRVLNSFAPAQVVPNVYYDVCIASGMEHNDARPAYCATAVGLKDPLQGVTTESLVTSIAHAYAGTINNTSNSAVVKNLANMMAKAIIDNRVASDFSKVWDPVIMNLYTIIYNNDVITRTGVSGILLTGAIANFSGIYTSRDYLNVTANLAGEAMRGNTLPIEVDESAVPVADILLLLLNGRANDYMTPVGTGSPLGRARLLTLGLDLPPNNIVIIKTDDTALPTAPVYDAFTQGQVASGSFFGLPAGIGGVPAGTPLPYYGAAAINICLNFIARACPQPEALISAVELVSAWSACYPPCQVRNQAGTLACHIGAFMQHGTLTRTKPCYGHALVPRLRVDEHRLQMDSLISLLTAGPWFSLRTWILGSGVLAFSLDHAAREMGIIPQAMVPNNQGSVVQAAGSPLPVSDSVVSTFIDLIKSPIGEPADNEPPISIVFGMILKGVFGIHVTRTTRVMGFGSNATSAPSVMPPGMTSLGNAIERVRPIMIGNGIIMENSTGLPGMETQVQGYGIGVLKSDEIVCTDQGVVTAGVSNSSYVNADGGGSMSILGNCGMAGHGAYLARAQGMQAQDVSISAYTIGTRAATNVTLPTQEFYLARTSPALQAPALIYRDAMYANRFILDMDYARAMDFQVCITGAGGLAVNAIVRSQEGMSYAGLRYLHWAARRVGGQLQEISAKRTRIVYQIQTI